MTWLLPMGIERPSGNRYFQLARQLVRRGHHVRLLALHPDLAHCPQRRFCREGVEVWYVGQMHARKSDTHPSRFGPLELLRVLVMSTMGMVWGVICSPAEVYHLGKPQPINGLAALIGVMLMRRKPFYVDCDDDEVASNRLNAGWQRAVFGWWQRVLPALARGVTVNTRFLLQRMKQEGVAKTAYVPNGVDLDHWHGPPQRQLQGLRAGLGLSRRRVIAYVGTLALQNHPVDLLLDAFALIAQEQPEVDLLLVGGGEDLRLLQEKLPKLGLMNRVYFTGHVPPSHVRSYLALAEISVDPVLDDTVARARSPLKLFESMALGVPVVTGDVGDRAELLHFGEAGVLVEPGDARALAGGLLELLKDQVRRSELAARARRHVEQYSWERLAGSWEQLYR